MVAWDDWNLSMGRGGWEGLAPYIFFDRDAISAVFQSYWVFTKFKDYLKRTYNIEWESWGVSYFVHRFVPLSRIISFKRGDEFVCHNNDKVTIIIRSYCAPDLSCVTARMFEFIKGVLEVKEERYILSFVRTLIDEYCAQESDCDTLLEINGLNVLFGSVATIFKNSGEVSDCITNIKRYLFGDHQYRGINIDVKIKEVLALSALFFSIRYVYRNVNEVVYIPSRGFESDGKEECSGGIYVWCGKDSEVNAYDIQAYDTYRGLRTSIVDWTTKQNAELKHRARRNARSAIMSRNLSHNMGSHALANARFFDAVGFENESTAKGRLGDFNAYLQGRLDFIARTTGGTSAHPELMYFVRDLVAPFLDQKILLDTLLSDNGYSSQNIEFHIHLPDMKEGEFLKLCPKDPRGKGSSIEKNTPPESYGDVMVAVPGGMVGRHAFYAFLENVMRNAAKYGRYALGGRSSEKCHQLVIRLALAWSEKSAIGMQNENGFKYSDGYVLTVSDNLSVGTDSKTIIKLREYLDQDIIDENDNERVKGHGIQEMKVCAEFLAGGENNALRFESDCEIRNNNQSNNRCHPLSDYVAYIQEYCRCEQCVKSGIDPEPDPQKHCIQGRHSLACYGTGENKQDLTYGLLLQRPVLLGIVDLARGEAKYDRNNPVNHHTVVYYSSIEELAKGPAYFGLILIQSGQGVEDLLSEIGEYHQALPFRLMLVVKNEKEVGRVKDKISKNNKLPVRRVHVISCPELFSTEDLDTDSWEKLIITIYDKWLWAYKGHELEECGEECWHLGIGFERSRDSVLARWNLGHDDQIDLGFGWSDMPNSVKHLDVHIFYTVSGGSGHICNNGQGEEDKVLWKDGDESKSITKCREQALALDNHYKVLPGEFDRRIDRAIACYQGFKGSEQPALGHLLETPPGQRFARSFLIFSIAEALLTNVVVVDERVAEGMIGEFQGRDTVYRSENTIKRHKARIFPVYHIRSGGGQDQKTLPLSVRVREVVTNDLDCKHNKAINKDIMSEGVGPGSLSVVCEHSDRELHLEKLEEKKIDFIIIHEGVIDTMDFWSDGYLEALYGVCPSVVRTSGRGYKSPSIGESLPFLEFTELADTVQRGLDKVSLGRVLLSVRGDVKRRER